MWIWCRLFSYINEKLKLRHSMSGKFPSQVTHEVPPGKAGCDSSCRSLLLVVRITGERTQNAGQELTRKQKERTYKENSPGNDQKPVGKDQGKNVVHRNSSYMAKQSSSKQTNWKGLLSDWVTWPETQESHEGQAGSKSMSKKVPNPEIYPHRQKYWQGADNNPNTG